MASEQDLKNLSRLRARGSSAPQVVPRLPPLPDEVVKRFPSMKQWWEKADKQYREEFAVALGWHVDPRT